MAMCTLLKSHPTLFLRLIYPKNLQLINLQLWGLLLLLSLQIMNGVQYEIHASLKHFWPVFYSGAIQQSSLAKQSSLALLGLSPTV